MKYLRLLNLTIIPFICFFIINSCATSRLKKNLDPESKVFLSVVRYIITKQEKKIFLNLPPSERKSFIENFWKKRDPDPYTEVNEFKEEYFRRIEMANKLFKGGPTPGWLQDRGRIYILLGPPDERYTYPRGYSFYENPSEVWYYGFFPIVFVDYSWSGDYDLTPLGARHLAQIMKTQMEWKPKVTKEKVVFDFNVEIFKTEENEVKIEINIPYEHMWMTEKGNRLETKLKLSVEIRNAATEEKVWEDFKVYPFMVKSSEVENLTGKEYVIDIPVKLPKGTYIGIINLENTTGEEKREKKIKFSL